MIRKFMCLRLILGFMAIYVFLSNQSIAASFKNVIESKNFKGVDVSTLGGRVFVESHKGSAIHIELKAVSSTETCAVKMREDVSELEVVVEDKNSKDSKSQPCTDSLLLKIPENLYIDLKTLHSDAEFKGKFQGIEYDSRAGSFDADIDVESVEVSTTSGSIKLKVFAETEIDLDSTAGSIQLELKAISTDKNLAPKSKEHDVKIKTQSGSVVVYIGEISFVKYKFELETNRGQIKNDFVAQLNQGKKEVRERFKIRTAAGDIKIINSDKK